MAAGSLHIGRRIRWDLDCHARGIAGDAVGVKRRRRDHQQHDYRTAERKRSALLAVLSWSDRLFGHLAADLKIDRVALSFTLPVALPRRAFPVMQESCGHFAQVHPLVLTIATFGLRS